jgi:hypothetical protein
MEASSVQKLLQLAADERKWIARDSPYEHKTFVMLDTVCRALTKSLFAL